MKGNNYIHYCFSFPHADVYAMKVMPVPDIIALTIYWAYVRFFNSFICHLFFIYIS